MTLYPGAAAARAVAAASNVSVARNQPRMKLPFVDIISSATFWTRVEAAMKSERCKLASNLFGGGGPEVTLPYSGASLNSCLWMYVHQPCRTTLCRNKGHHLQSCVGRISPRSGSRPPEAAAAG